MGLFKSEEEKAAAQAEKEQKLLQKYGLESLTNPKDVAAVKAIANELMGNNLMDAGMKLSMGAKPEDQLQVSYQKTIVEQNFMIIRKLCEISEKM